MFSREMIEVRHKSGMTDLQAGYNKIFSSESIAQPEMAYRWFMEQLRPEPGSTILDTACGEGTLLQQAVKWTEQVFGVDFSAAAIEVAKRAVPHGSFTVSDGARLPYADDSFDYVTNIGSLEHYEQMELGSQEMARVLKPSGRAMILLPNLFGMLWNVQYVKHTGDVCDDGQPLQRYATPTVWRKFLEENGFIVEEMLPFGWAYPMTWRDWLYYLKRPKLLLVLYFWQPRQFPNLANTLIYMCRKKG